MDGRLGSKSQRKCGFFGMSAECWSARHDGEEAKAHEFRGTVVKIEPGELFQKEMHFSHSVQLWPSRFGIPSRAQLLGVAHLYQNRVEGCHARTFMKPDPETPVLSSLRRAKRATRGTRASRSQRPFASSSQAGAAPVCSSAGSWQASIALTTMPTENEMRQLLR